ncbi:MAG: helix-turn-helix domain-containing protein [Gemmatimonadota bacterium]|jgi:hypothetical protein
MSAHFAVFQVAGLVETEKDGRAVIYRLKRSVLEDALPGFADALGIDPARKGACRTERGRACRRGGRPDERRREEGRRPDAGEDRALPRVARLRVGAGKPGT